MTLRESVLPSIGKVCRNLLTLSAHVRHFDYLQFITVSSGAMNILVTKFGYLFNYILKIFRSVIASSKD